MKAGRAAGLASVFVLTAAAVCGYIFRQDIYDWNRLRNYTPPPTIVQLADDTAMVAESRRLFYVYHPLLADKSTFNTYCRDSEQTIVLGCYIHNQGIYLFDITDERLAGVEQVTAAHEMLHAAYARLDDDERADIDAMLLAAFESLKSNTRLVETVELYRKRDPSVVPNELHSILATEIRTLPAGLEAYYKRYFTDRQKVVSFSEQYEQAFTERRNAVRAYDEQLADLKAQIDSLQASLNQTNQELNAQRNQMNSLRASGQTQAYNEQVPSYNAKVNQYNRDIDRLEALIVRYNDIVQKRNDIVAEEAELVEAIDSREVVPQER